MEWDCEGCGVHVVSALDPACDLFCAECVWLDDVYWRDGIVVATAVDQSLRQLAGRGTSGRVIPPLALLRCGQCGRAESELHRIGGVFVCPACSRTMAEGQSAEVAAMPEDLCRALEGWWRNHHHGVSREMEDWAEQELCRAINPRIEAIRARLDGKPAGKPDAETGKPEQTT